MNQNFDVILMGLSIFFNRLIEFLSPAPRIMDIQYDVHNKEKEMFFIHDKNQDHTLDWDELKEYSYGT